LEGSDKLSITLRTTLRKAGKALSKMSVDLAKPVTVSQLDDLKLEASARGLHWTLIRPSLIFSIKKAQEAASLATAARESKTKSDEVLRVASKQAGSLRLEDMMFEFQV
jgi:hypothetical protein